MSTQIVGLFKNVTYNIEKVVCEVLDTGQANHQMNHVGYGGTPPECNIGYDEKGVSIVSLREHGYGHKDDWLVWRRADYEVRDIHDPHTLGPVFAFESHGPGKADTQFILTKNVIDFCKAAYRIQTQTEVRGRAEIKSDIEKSGSDMLPVERIVTLTRDMRSEEVENHVTLVEGGETPPYTLGGNFDNTAYEEWYDEYRHREFVFIDHGWEGREVPGPEIDTLPIEWGTKKGQHVIMTSRNRPWGDGGVSWGTKWRMPGSPCPGD